MTDHRTIRTDTAVADAPEVRELTFDGSFDPRKYGGFVWSHFDRVDSHIPASDESSGGGMARNIWAQGSSFASTNGSFDVQSLQLMSDLEPLSIRIVGVSSGHIVIEQTVRVGTDGLARIELGWHGIDKVFFDVDPAGTSHPNALFFRMDDLVVQDSAGSVTGTLVFDANANGSIDAGEAGINGRIVILDDNGNGVIDAGERFARTDASGGYAFARVADGTHTVTQVLPANWAQTGPAGATSVSVTDGGAATADLLSAHARDVLGTIAGVLYDDYDRSGGRNGGEPGLAGWTVFADANHNGVRDAGELFTTTDAHGRYALDNLPVGAVTVRAELPASWQQWAGGVAEATAVAGTRSGLDLALTGAATQLDDVIVATGKGHDVIATLGGDDRVIARSGNDIVDGGAGDDILGGGYGDDVLIGGAGIDRLIGGLGADLFQIDGRGSDRILDFEAGDHIRVVAEGVTAFADLQISMQGDDTIVGWAGTAAAVIVRDAPADLLDATAFVFGA